MARRNNSTRTQAPHPAADNTPITTGPDVDIFSFVTPTEFVELPSQGRYYPAGHALHKQTTIEIRHMTAKEEDILTSETLLKKGLALDRLIQSVIITPGVNVNDLLVGDKNALLIASRITGFGPLYEAKVTCPSCTEGIETTFDLATLPLVHAETLPDEVTYRDGEFCFMLPKTGVEIGVKLLTVTDETLLVRQNERRKKMKMRPGRSTELLKTVITSVGGHTDKEKMAKFIDMMPLSDVKHLRNIYEQIKPDIDVECDFSCDMCDHEGKVVMPLTAAFFWPRR